MRLSPLVPGFLRADTPLRRRLWAGAGGVGLFVATTITCLCFIAPGYDACRRAVGHDFLAFYTAGKLVREGRTTELYDLDAVGRMERETAAAAGIDLGDAIGPWWNPPIFAYAFAPLAAMPFGTALSLWLGINIAAALAAAWLVARLAAPAGGPDRLLVALLVLLSAPLLQSLAHGQNSAISLLLVALAVTAWRGGYAFAAGAGVGLLLYKPQLAAALAAVLVLHRGRRAFAGVASVGGVMLLLTLLVMPGALADYVHRLPQNLHTMQVEDAYLWDRHVTLRAFWRLLLQGRGPGETGWFVQALTAACCVPLMTGLALAAFRARRRGNSDDLIAATVAAAPLLMPFYFDYDLLLLAAAAALVTGAGTRSPATWAALYLWLFVNPYVAGLTRVNLAVPLLFALALLLVDRALHGQREAVWTAMAGKPHPLLARAA